jgi:alkanesulfonate monooxygenase SsuD/methylene tetrahydromethanopterin reductase-like flavin-dependent oxidoreductase (luciferase family)
VLDHIFSPSRRSRRTCASARWSAALRTATGIAGKVINIDVISGGRLDWVSVPVGTSTAQRTATAPGRENIRACCINGRDREVDVEPARHHLRRRDCGRAVRSKPLPGSPADRSGRGRTADPQIVARHADRSNFGGKPHSSAHARSTGCCEVSWNRQDLALRSSCMRPSRNHRCRESLGRALILAKILVGTPEQVCEKIRAYALGSASGHRGLAVGLPGHADRQLFAEGHPQFR